MVFKIFKALSIFLAMAGFVSCTSTSTGEKPNIILIIADDMNWDDSGIYGHPHIRTPHIDQLAKDGIRFTSAYLTTNSCSPSRSSIITGRYPHNTGAEQLHWALPGHSVTFVEKLREAGYYTAAAGKWHLGEEVKDRFDTIHEASVSGFQLPTGDGKTPPKMVAKKPAGCEDWIPTLQNRPKDKPFFLWFAALDPHREYEDGALNPPHKLSDIIIPPHMPDTPEVREDFRLYYDEIGRLDNYVGRVVAELEKQGVADNTVIVFISDNGRPFPRDKTSLFDGGIKTPWIVKWPGNAKAGSVSGNLVSSVDLAKTFLEMAGVKAGKTFEGVSLVPAFKDANKSVRDYIYAEDHWHDYEDHGRAVCDGRYKLIRNTYSDLAATPSADAGRSPTWQTMLKLKEQGKLTKAQLYCFEPREKWELYDLKNDPQELKNLAKDKKYEYVLKRLVSEMDAWSKRTGDFIPSKRTPDEFDRVTGEPDHSVRKRPRPNKKDMFGTYGEY